MVSPYPPRCTRRQSSCHPPLMPIAIAAMVVGMAGFVEPVSALSASDLLGSSSGRASLLEHFSGGGSGATAGGEQTRFRPNRRHPDVGFTSLDPICVACVLDQAASSADQVPATPKPSSAQQPSASDAWTPPPPAPAALPQESTPVPLVTLEVVQPPVPRMTLLAIESPLPFPLDEAPPPIRQAPAALPILGAGGTMALSRKLRNRIRAARGN